MAPVATETMSSTLATNGASAPHFNAVKAPALVIGSPASALDGSYQAVVSELETSRHVERQMVDRLLDGGINRSRSCNALFAD